VIEILEKFWSEERIVGYSEGYDSLKKEKRGLKKG